VKKPWQFIERKPTAPPVLQGPAVRHKGHTFMRHNTYKGGRIPQEVRVSFRCKVCGLAAIAEKHGQAWKEWSGEGTQTTCGEQIAKEVMDS